MVRARSKECDERGANTAPVIRAANSMTKGARLRDGPDLSRFFNPGAICPRPIGTAGGPRGCTCRVRSKHETRPRLT